MNNLKVIKNEIDHKAALARLQELMNAPAGSPEEQELDLLSFLIEKYEQEHFPVGLPDSVEAIKFRMEQQGLIQKDLVKYIGSQSKVSEVLNYKRPLSLSMIRALHEGLGIPAEVLLQEPGKQLPPAHYDPQEYPLKEMYDLGFFPGITSFRKVKEGAQELLENLFASFRQITPQTVFCRNSALPLSTNQSAPALGYAIADGTESYAITQADSESLASAGQPSDPAINIKSLSAWQARVLQLAGSQDTADFSFSAISADFLKGVVRLSVFPNGPILAEQVLLNTGVHFVVLPHLPQTYLDGSCFLAPSGKPVIGMTIRYDRLDIFWFTLMHELSHLVLHLQEHDYVFFDDIEHSMTHASNQYEVEANQYSQNLLIPPEIWSQEKETLTASKDENQVIRFANRIGISPAIVAGRIRWELNDYSLFNDLLGNRIVRELFSLK